MEEKIFESKDGKKVVEYSGTMEELLEKKAANEKAEGKEAKLPG